MKLEGQKTEASVPLFRAQSMISDGNLLPLLIGFLSILAISDAGIPKIL